MILLANRFGRPVTPAAPGRMVALDGLRGIAVLLVLVEHFTYNEIVRGWSPGAVGVKTFFVLSGFLITGVLLDLRHRATPLDAAKQFFVRRMRRLLPAFLMAILLGLALGLGGLQRDWPWHLSYLSNVQVWWQGNWSHAGHFWTLAVEQQFYLLWFPVVVLLPRRHLLPVVLALLVLAPLFRAAILYGASPFIDVLLPAQADAMAAGALLALVMRHEAPGWIVARLSAPVTTWLSLLLLVTLLSLPGLGLHRSVAVSWVLLPSVIVLTALAIITAAIHNPQRLGLLRAPFLVWIGTISYGLYIYHYFVPQFIVAYVPVLAAPDAPAVKVIRLVVWVTLSIALAAASWRFIEKPVINAQTRPIARSGVDGV